MELLKQLVPALRRVAILWDPACRPRQRTLTDVRNAAGSLGLRLQIVEARGADDYEGAFAAMAKERTRGACAVM